MGTTRKVRDTMTAEPNGDRRSTALSCQAAELMAKENVGSFPVVENGELIGIVTDRDLVMQVVARGLDPKSVKVADVYTDKPVVAAPDEPLDRRCSGWPRSRCVGCRSSPTAAGRACSRRPTSPARRTPQSTGQMVEEISQK